MTRIPFRFSILLLAASAVLQACSSSAPSQASTDVPPAEECTAYAAALRACLTATGSPTRAADAVAASALTPRDEATRASMNSECAHNRVQLQASCK